MANAKLRRLIKPDDEANASEEESYSYCDGAAKGERRPGTCPIADPILVKSFPTGPSIAR